MSLTVKQKKALKLCSGVATHIMLFGGGRSGKTFLFVRNIVVRALKANGSRHVIFRYRLNHIRASIFLDTFPKVMKLLYPDIEYKTHTQEMYIELPNDSQIWFGGLDDKERTEKILGMEFVTIYFNETSQIPYASVLMAITRLAQLTEQTIEGSTTKTMPVRAYYDCNPTSKNHWTYKIFIEKRDPETKKNLASKEDYVYLQINPKDNLDNLSPEYIKQLEALPARMRKRFLEGSYSDTNPNSLFPCSEIDKWRVLDGDIPDMVRVVVSVDPSGADDVDNADNDEIGIMVAGLGTDGNAYILEDCTVKAGPGTWGRVATSAFDRHAADCIVAETNFGGAMVKQTINVARPRTPFKKVVASRGKVARAEPYSALYEQGKVRHVGLFPDLEEELEAFSTVGYLGAGSPNRGDALVWALTELFPSIIKATKVKQEVEIIPVQHYWR